MLKFYLNTINKTLSKPLTINKFAYSERPILANHSSTVWSSISVEDESD